MSPQAPSPANSGRPRARGARGLEEETCGAIASACVLEYRRAAVRVLRASEEAGVAWTVLEGMTDASATYYVLRAAWSRLSHAKVAAAVLELQDGRVTASDATARLARWVPHAER